MTVPGTTPERYDVPAEHLADLQAVLKHEIPMCAQMGIEVESYTPGQLSMMLPLEKNRNHQQTAFAGSLNALCTIAGWGTVYLALRRLGCEGTIVIRRSTIRYHRPVVCARIVARCLPIDPVAEQHFADMYLEKGQAKLDLMVEIQGEDRTAVSFAGSYVVSRQEAAILAFL